MDGADFVLVDFVFLEAQSPWSWIAAGALVEGESGADLLSRA